MEGNAIVENTFTALAAHIFKIIVDTPEDLPAISLRYIGRFTPFAGKETRWVDTLKRRNKLIAKVMAKIMKPGISRRVAARARSAELIRLEKKKLNIE